MAIVALVFAGAALFFVGPMLLGIGGDEEAARATASPTTESSASPSPTLPPAPTPKIYVVVKGDTVIKIAKRNGVTVEALLAANPKLKKNPDRIKPGDEITIPVPEVEAAPEEVVESTVP
jgi:LysM repeat protein